MKISISSDCHDDYENLEKVVAISNDRNCEVMLFAGDLVAPINLQALKKFNGKVILIFGNNEGEIYKITKVSVEEDWLELARTSHGGDSYEGELGGKKVFMHHRPRIAEIAAKSGEFDVCIFGHTHTYHLEKVGNTTLVNPGSINSRNSEASFVLYDTENEEVEKILL